MQKQMWWLAVGLSLLAASPAAAEVLRGVMSVRGAEMN
jgi:hypothetical protein